MPTLWVWHLAGGGPTPLKNDGVKVSWDYIILYIFIYYSQYMGKKCSKPPYYINYSQYMGKNMFQTTNQNLIYDLCARILHDCSFLASGANLIS